MPDQDLSLIKCAIKVVMVQTILGVSLTLEEIPEAFKHDYFRGYSGPQPDCFYSQSPRLLNRQVKVAFALVYNSLLQQALKGFKYLVTIPESWATCLFISICLAILLERIEAGSQEFLHIARNVYKVEPGSISEVEDYCREVDVIVFDRIYRLLRTTAKDGSPGRSIMNLKLLDALKRVRRQFRRSPYVRHFGIPILICAITDFEGCQRSLPDVRFPYSSRLVSALLEMVSRV